MKKILAFIVITFVATQVWAGAFYEGFAYTANAGLTGNINTNSTAGNQTWVNTSAATPDNWITSGSLSYSGLPDSSGNAVTVTNSNAKINRIGIGGSNGSTNLFYSFLINMQNSAPSAANGTSGSFIAGFDTAAGTSTAAPVIGNLACRLMFFTNNAASGKFRLGVSCASASFITPDTTDRDQGTTYFVVMQYTPGGAAGDDVSRLWINPTISSTAPAPTQTSVGADPAGLPIKSLFLRCNTVAAKSIIFDEMRIGSTWEFAMGAPQFDASPTNLTAGATSTANFYATVASPSTNAVGYQWLKDGVPLVDGGNVSGAGTTNLILTGVAAADAASYSLVASNNPYTPSISVTSSVAVLTVNDPVITTQPSPASQQQAPGVTVNYNVVAAGTPTLTYQWKKNGSNLTDGGVVAGATTANLTLTSISSLDAGTYTCAVTNGLASGLVSSNAVLLVIDPAITSQPQSLTRTNGDTASFSVSAAGTPTLYYQWRSNGVDMVDGGNVSGANASTLVLSSVSYLDAKSYTAVVTNTLGSVTSSVATLTVRDPWITAQPGSLIRAAGAEAIFTVGVTSSTPGSLVYIWKKGSTVLTDGGTLSGVNASALTISSCNATDGVASDLITPVNYSVIVSNADSLQIITSSNCSLTVVNPPLDRTVKAGVGVAFNPGIFGTNSASAFTFQWYSNGVPIPGATSRTLSLSSVQSGYAASYSIDVTSATGTASGTGVLSVVTGTIFVYPTNLVVARVGDGAQTLRDAGNSIFLDQFNTSGTYQNTITIPDSGSDSIVAKGTTGDTIGSFNGMTTLTTSEDGKVLVLNGYRTNYNLVDTVVRGSAGDTSPRAVTTINGLSQYAIQITGSPGNVFRCATFDGTNEFWGATSSSPGGYYFGSQVSAGTVGNINNCRFAEIYNGNLYISAANAGLGIYHFTGKPHPGDPNPVQDIPISATPSTGAAEFNVSPDGNTIYIADGRAYAAGTTNASTGGVQKWEKVLGSFGSSPTRILRPDPNSTSGTLYLTVDYSGPNPVIYATTVAVGAPNKVVRIVDDGSNGGGGTSTVLAMSGPAQQFRGIRLGPASEPPAIAANPSSSTNCSGTTATFSVSATGTGPLAYQWRKNGTDMSDGGNVSGATSSSLTLSSITGSDVASYEVVVTGFGSVTSAPPAELVVNDPALITSDPTGGVFGNGATITLNAAASGSAPISYQWRKNGADVTDGGSVSGALTDSLTISPAGPGDSGSYELVVSNSCGSDTSAVAVVTVSCPTITVSPPTLPNGVQYTLYSAGVSGSGSSAVPYTYTAVGILPDGVVLNSSSGGISGIASNSGPFVFDIVATDTNGCSGTQSYSLSITSAAPDTSLPTVKFNTTPPNNAGVTTSPTNITGTAKDVGTAGIQEVVYSLNGGPTNNATTLSIGTGGNSNWTASVAMVPGTNSVTIQARDKANNLSTVASTHTRKYFLSVAGTYTLAIIGDGTVAGTLVSGDPANPGTSGAPLKIGRKYTVTATAGANYLFTNWTISVDGGPTTVATASNKYSFTMSSNVVLSANFITNNFIGAAGTYYGLYNDIGVAHQSAGWFTVKTDSKQKFSGKLLVQGEVVAISGTFNQAGHGTLKPGKVFARKGLTNYPIVVALDLALDGSDVITGTVTNAEGWEATMSGDRATFSLTSPATNYLGSNGLGQYTFVYPGSLSAATEPGGDGYGLVQLGADGKVKPTGGRAGDYHLLKSTVTSISKNGAWPFYAPMYVAAEARTSPAFTAKTYKGSTFGWLYFSNNTVSGDLFWNKVSWTNGYYNSGFTNTQTIIGSGYIKPPVNNRVLTNVTTMTALLADGNLVDTVTNNAYLALNNNIFFTNAIPPVNPRGIKGKVSTAKGEFSGSFTNSALSVKSLIKGVVLQDTVEVRGVFLGTNNSGSLRLTSP